MGLWDKLVYPGGRSYNTAYFDVVAPTSPGPALVYIPGGAWDTTCPIHLWYGDNHDPTEGERIYDVELDTLTADKRIACFSLNVAQHSYSRASIDTLPYWEDVPTAYVPGDVVRYDPDDPVTQPNPRPWRCRSNNAGIPPVQGNDWYQIPLSDPSIQLFGEFDMQSGYRDAASRDAVSFLSWLQDKAAQYEFDLDELFLMGVNNGGIHAALAAYGTQATYADRAVPWASRLNAHHGYQRPVGLILRNTQCDLRQVTTVGRLANLYGLEDLSAQTDWAAMRQLEKDALSPLRVVMHSQASVPTFFGYTEAGFAHDTESPDYDNPMSPDHGWALFDYLVNTLGQESCVFSEALDTAGAFRYWPGTTDESSAVTYGDVGLGVTPQGRATIEAGLIRGWMQTITDWSTT